MELFSIRSFPMRRIFCESIQNNYLKYSKFANSSVIYRKAIISQKNLGFILGICYDKRRRELPGILPRRGFSLCGG